MKWVPCRIKSRKVWSQGLFTLSIEAPGVAPFEPGQFLQLGMNCEDKHLHRPYSVASPHGDVLEFFIVLVENGQLTPKLWAMNEGDPIDVSASAAGSFTISHTPCSDVLWMIGTGTGLAPYVAMLRNASTWDRYKNLVLVHGVRHGSDLAYQEEFSEHSRKYPDRFQYVPIASREKLPGALAGRITHVLATGELEESVGHRIDPSNSAVMLCGNPDMLNDMEANLNERGLRKHKAKEPGHIVIERYW